MTYNKSCYFTDNFQGVGGPSRKSMKIPRTGARLLERKILGVGQTEKNRMSLVGMDIFWNHTIHLTGNKSVTDMRSGLQFTQNLMTVLYTCIGNLPFKQTKKKYLFTKQTWSITPI